MKRSTLSRDIKHIVKSLDQIKGVYYEAVECLSYMIGDDKLSVTDRFKASFALSCLNDLDPLYFEDVLNVINSMDKTKSIKNLSITNDEASEEKVNALLKKAIEMLEVKEDIKID